MKTVILAGSVSEAARFSKAEGIRATYIASSASARAHRPTKIYILPGFHRRRDRHDIERAYRFLRPAPERIEIDSVPVPEQSDLREMAKLMADLPDLTPENAATVKADLIRAEGD